MRIIELFSGCGGLARGMANAGFEERALVEYNRDACASLRLNFDPAIVHECDIRTFDYTPYLDQHIDAIAGGPPCQPFSLGGKAAGQNDARDMFPEAARAIAELHPRGFLFENVKGLLRKSFAEYFRYIILRLTYPSLTKRQDETWQQHSQRLSKVQYNLYHGTKYRVQYRLVNAADYGVPQIRERVIIVGIRDDVQRPWAWPQPTRTKATWKTIAEALEGVPEPVETPPADRPDNILRRGARPYPGHTGSAIDQPSKAIKAGVHGVPGGENTLLFPDGRLRYMSVHEAKLIQSFPADYRIAGSWTEALRQIGNAVPVELATVMGRQLYETIQY